MVATSFARHSKNIVLSKKAAIHRLVNELVAYAHDLGKEDQNDADDQTAHRRLKDLGPLRHSMEQPSGAEQTFAEGQRNDAAHNPKEQVTNQLSRIDEMIGRHMKDGIIAQNGAFDDDRCHGGHNRRTQQGRVHVADDLFEGKDHRGDRSIERGR